MLRWNESLIRTWFASLPSAKAPPVKFALLGDDPQAIQLARAAARAPHELVWIGQSGPATVELLERSPQATVGERWEVLLTERVADAVILGRSGDDAKDRERLRLLAQSAVPLVVSHPACLDVLFYYEIEMVREEARGVLHPVVLGRGHPALREMAACCKASHGAPDEGTGGIGRVDQLVVERSLARRDRDSVLATLARDAMLITEICGRIEQVSAMGSVAKSRAAEAKDGEPLADALAGLGVQLATEGGVAVRWSMLPAGPEDAATWTLHGETGRAVLNMRGEAPWRFTWEREAALEPLAFEDYRPVENELAVAAESIKVEGGVGDWLNAARSLEVVDAAEQSLRRGRAIELYELRPSEASTFKGVMSAMGCGILVAGLVLAVVVGILGDALNLPFTRYWYVVLLLVMVLFLLLQFLPTFLLGGRSGKRPADS